MKKLISLLLCICLSFALVGCKPDPDGDTIRIGVITGEDDGLGLQWSEVMKEKVETALKDKKYGKKTGVTWENTNENATLGDFADGDYHIFFINGGDIKQGLAQDAYLELTDLYKREIDNRGGEALTLEDKIYDEMRANYGIQQSDGSWKYYGLPYQEYYAGLTYNRVLWERHGFYFVTEEYPNAVEISNPDFGRTYYIAGSDGDKMDSDAKNYFTPGPDGDFETKYDNGLPSSWYEFITLCDYMNSEANVKPIALSGEMLNYSNSMFEGIYESLLGNDGALTSRNLSGQVDVVVDYEDEPLFNVSEDSDLYNIKKPKVQRINITENSGYYVSWSIEKYFTTLLAQICSSYEWWESKSTNDHKETQRDFLYGVYQTPEVAMLSEFSYWQNESIKSGIHGEVMYNSTGRYETIDSLDVSWMPLPVNIEHSVTGEDDEVALTCVTQVGSNPITENLAGDAPTLSTQVGSLNSVVAVNKKNVTPGTYEYDAIMDALAIVYSDECMSACTASTGQFWTLDYALTEDDKSVATKFYSDLNEIRQAGKVFYQLSESEAYNKNMIQLFAHGFGSRLFSIGGNAKKNVVQLYQGQTEQAAKSWVKGADGSKTIKNATMIFEELMIDYSTWKGVWPSATIVNDVKYAPCERNGGYSNL